MKTNHKIHCAVAAILAASSAARAAEPATGEAATETTGISEVVVTAQWILWCRTYRSPFRR